MKKIVLLCAAGMSTSLLVKKMRDAASKEGFDCQIDAYPVAEAAKYGLDADLILLGPQVRFNLKDVQSKCPGKIVEAIDMGAYGMMDGAKVIAKARKTLGF